MTDLGLFKPDEVEILMEKGIIGFALEEQFKKDLTGRFEKFGEIIENFIGLITAGQWIKFEAVELANLEVRDRFKFERISNLVELFRDYDVSFSKLWNIAEHDEKEWVSNFIEGLIKREILSDVCAVAEGYEVEDIHDLIDSYLDYVGESDDFMKVYSPQDVLGGIDLWLENRPSKPDEPTIVDGFRDIEEGRSGDFGIRSSNYGFLFLDFLKKCKFEIVIL